MVDPPTSPVTSTGEQTRFRGNCQAVRRGHGGFAGALTNGPSGLGLAEGAVLRVPRCQGCRSERRRLVKNLYAIFFAFIVETASSELSPPKHGKEDQGDDEESTGSEDVVAASWTSLGGNLAAARPLLWIRERLNLSSPHTERTVSTSLPSTLQTRSCGLTSRDGPLAMTKSTSMQPETRP